VDVGNFEGNRQALRIDVVDAKDGANAVIGLGF
jgi:hypothetical protein